MLADLQKNLEPATFVRTALTCSQAEFVRTWGETILLVQAEDPRSPLAITLRSGQAGTLPSTAVRRIAVHTIAEVAAITVPPQDAWPESLIVHQLRGRLVRMLHFAAPLTKRSDHGPTSDRFLIGRGRDNDVLLVHESVSKLHAWLRRIEDGRYQVTDSGSRNGTSVNGKPITPQRPVPLTAGDILCFGKVEVMLCPALAAWEALRRR